MMTRRFFLGALAVITSAGGSGLGSMLARRRRVATARIDSATLQPLEGREVVLRGAEGESLRARVAEVRIRRTPARWSAPATEQISLLLHPRAPEVGDGHYRLESDDHVLGDLYFSPVGPAGSERRLEAVITRIV